MATVTANVRTWGFDAFPASERLLVWFDPSSAGMAGTAVFPERRVSVEPAPDGSVSVQLTPTTDVIPDVWFTVRFEWFDKHPISGQWNHKGWSTLPGKLRVPPSGGALADLMDTPPPPGAILHGHGDPPTAITNVTYWDIAGERPVLWVPPGGSI